MGVPTKLTRAFPEALDKLAMCPGLLWCWLDGTGSDCCLPIYFISSEGKHNYEERGTNSWKPSLSVWTGSQLQCKQLILNPPLEGPSSAGLPGCLDSSHTVVTRIKGTQCYPRASALVDFWKELLLLLSHVSCRPVSMDLYFFFKSLFRWVNTKDIKSCGVFIAQIRILFKSATHMLRDSLFAEFAV